MIGVHKKFNPKLYEENDKKARQAIRQILLNSEFELREPDSKYDVDFHVYYRGVHIANLELEIKQFWKKGRFPADTVQWPERKNKYAKLSKPTLFVIFCADMSEYLVTAGSCMLASPLVEVSNKYESKNEMFYQVPIELIVFNKLEDLLKGIVALSI